jgi:Prokaryotic N-terminal methylation motif
MRPRRHLAAPSRRTVFGVHPLGCSTSRFQAFTLVEILIAMGVMSLLVIGLVSTNILGMITYQNAQNTLTATDGPRIALAKFTDDVRNAQSVLVGSLTNGVFAGVVSGESQTGSALMIYPTTNTTAYVIYYFNAPDQTFRRTTSAANSTQILAESVTNTIVFTAEDCLGNVLTNNLNNRVIHACLEVFIPKGNAPSAVSYKLEGSATQRAF